MTIKRSGEHGVDRTGASESLLQSFSPCVCLTGRLYLPPAEIRMRQGTTSPFKHEVVSGDDLHQCFRGRS